MFLCLCWTEANHQCPDLSCICPDYDIAGWFVSGISHKFNSFTDVCRHISWSSLASAYIYFQVASKACFGTTLNILIKICYDLSMYGVGVYLCVLVHLYPTQGPERPCVTRIAHPLYPG